MGAKQITMPHPTSPVGVKSLSDDELWHWFAWHQQFVSLMQKEIKRREKIYEQRKAS